MSPRVFRFFLPLFLAAYGTAGFLTHSKFGGRELFTLFSWSLYSDAARVEVQYTARLLELDGRPLTPVVDLMATPAFHRSADYWREVGVSNRSYLLTFWGVQCAALLTYSMSGLTKIATGSWQLVTQGAGIRTPDAFSLHMANAGIRFGVEPIFGNLAIRAGVLSLPLYLGVIYLETFAFPIAFRAALHRVWGVALIAMHLGVGLFLNVFFSPSIFVVGVLLLASPFSPERQGWIRTVRDLALIGRLVAGNSSEPPRRSSLHKHLFGGTE